MLNHSARAQGSRQFIWNDLPDALKAGVTQHLARLLLVMVRNDDEPCIREEANERRHRRQD